MKSFFIFLLLLIGIIAADEPCTLTAKTSKGTFNFDLRSLGKDQPYSATATDYKYLINFCKPIPVQCAEKGAGFKAIQVHQPSEDLCFYLASTSNNDVQMSLIEDSNPDAGVYVQYTGGERTYDGLTRNARIKVKCGKSISSVRFITEETRGQANVYDFEMEAPEGCPGGAGGSGFCSFINPLCSLSVLFFIPLMIIGSILYVVIGLIVSKFVLKKKGLEIIPNLHFWKALPFLIKDGALVVFRFVKAIILKIKDLIMKILKKGKYQQLK